MSSIVGVNRERIAGRKLCDVCDVRIFRPFESCVASRVATFFNRSPRAALSTHHLSSLEADSQSVYDVGDIEQRGR
jgi:hypothetical protein